MTSKPPEADPAEDETPIAEPPRERDEGSAASSARRIALVGGLVVAAVVVAVLLMDSDEPQRAPAGDTGPEQGVACPFLRHAFEEFEAGNEVAFAEAVRVAARKAELTLERSGQVFGRPEELALELRSIVEHGADRQDVQDLLSTVRTGCADLGRWFSRSEQEG